MSAIPNYKDLTKAVATRMNGLRETQPDLMTAFGQLAAAGTSLRDIIASARLAQALTLLISTRLPVKSVAQRVGYASAASFSKRFTERYGVEPSRVSSA